MAVSTRRWRRCAGGHAGWRNVSYGAASWRCRCSTCRRSGPAARSWFPTTAVDAHVRGLDRVLALLGMVPGSAAGVDPAGGAGAGLDQPPVHLGRFIWLRCDDAGWWEPVVQPGETGRVTWRAAS